MKYCAKKAYIVLSVTALLAVVVLFAVGPQFGSFDADGDGVPEIPIMVSHRSDTASFLPILEHIQHAIFVSVALSLFP